MTPGEEILSIISEAVKSLNGHLMLVGACSRDYWIQAIAWNRMKHNPCSIRY